MDLVDGTYAWPGPGPRVVVYDMGIKWNILRLLLDQGFDILAVPSTFTADQVKRLSPDAVFSPTAPAIPRPCPD